MPDLRDSDSLEFDNDATDPSVGSIRQEALLKARARQIAIFNSAMFSFRDVDDVHVC